MNDFTFSFLEEQIRLAKKILILTHINPDGDALGSVMAMRSIILEMGKKEPAVFFTGVPSCNFKLEEKKIITSDTNYKNYDLLIILDTNNPRRTGVVTPENLSELPKTIIIDHHVKKNNGNNLDNIFCYIRPEATATCEIIFDLLKDRGVEISSNTAYYLLLGIFTDSGGFFHSNTTPTLLRKTKELLQKGVFFKNITQNAFKGKSVKILKFWGEKITTSRFHPKLKFIFGILKISEITQKNIPYEELSGLVNLLNMCKEAYFSLLLTDEGNKIKGSLRSHEHKKIDVSQISRFLGGGGHRLASGFEVYGKIVENKKKIFLER